MLRKEEALACARAYVREPFLRREKEAAELVKSIYVIAHQLAWIEATERATEIEVLLRLALGDDQNPVIYSARNCIVG